MRFITRAFVGPLRKLLETVRHYRYCVRMRDLVARGLVLGKNVTIADSAYIDSDYPYLIRISDNCSIAGDVRLLAHDATTFKFTDGHARLGKIEKDMLSPVKSTGCTLTKVSKSHGALVDQIRRTAILV